MAALPGLPWNSDDDRGASTWKRYQFETTTGQTRPFLHAIEPETRARLTHRRIETRTLIADFQSDVVMILMQSNLGTGGVGVDTAVPQRFLNDPVQCDGNS